MGCIMGGRGSHVVFLELRRDSRVTTGNSGCLLCWPRQVQYSIRVAKESWDCSRVTAGPIDLIQAGVQKPMLSIESVMPSNHLILCRPLHLSPSLFPSIRVFSRRCTGESLPLRVDFIHRVEFEEVSGHRVLIKRGSGNRGPSECGTTHEATSGMSS